MMLENVNSTRHNWAFQGEAEPGLDGRTLKHDRGKVLGGSSSINGMVYIRGHPQDFEGWAEAGCSGALHQSTAWSTSAAIRRTSRDGRRRAARGLFINQRHGLHPRPSAGLRGMGGD